MRTSEIAIPKTNQDSIREFRTWSCTRACHEISLVVSASYGEIALSGRTSVALSMQPVTFSIASFYDLVRVKFSGDRRHDMNIVMA